LREQCFDSARRDRARCEDACRAVSRQQELGVRLDRQPALHEQLIGQLDPRLRAALLTVSAAGLAACVWATYRGSGLAP